MLHQAINEPLDAPRFPRDMKLVVMGCSATKRPDREAMPGIHRYDGPMWQTLRTRLAELPAARAAVENGTLRIMVLSALYGYADAIHGNIPDYDRRMTPELAAKMARDPSYEFQMIPGHVEASKAVLFAGGETYRDAMRRAVGADLDRLSRITETDGEGIGVHRAQLGSWLRMHFGPAL
jgi:hypothetical protein